MLDLRRAVEILLEHDVRFILIGGQAAVVRGAAVLTSDLDICYDRSPDNLERLATALRSMHARLRGVEEDVPFILDAQTLRNGDSFTFITDVGSVDVRATPPGTSGFDDLVAGADRMDIAGLVIDVVGIDDLIRMKRAAGRPKDRAVVEILVALRDEIDAQP